MSDVIEHADLAAGKVRVKDSTGLLYFLTPYRTSGLYILQPLPIPKPDEAAQFAPAAADEADTTPPPKKQRRSK